MNDDRYLMRVEEYLVAKYSSPTEITRFIAVNKVKYAVSQGIGYEEENRTILSKSACLQRIADDMQRNVLWKSKRSSPHKAELKRPGVRTKYQEELEGLR